MHERRVSGTVIGLGFWWMPLVLVLWAARVTSADNIAVDCDNPMGPYGGNLQTAINSLNLPAAGHVITVTGTCTAGPGSFFIIGARHLTIQATTRKTEEKFRSSVQPRAPAAFGSGRRGCSCRLPAVPN